MLNHYQNVCWADNKPSVPPRDGPDGGPDGRGPIPPQPLATPGVSTAPYPAPRHCVRRRQNEPAAALRGRFHGIVVTNQRLCREHYRLTLHVAAFPPSDPGQFIQILCPRAPGAADLPNAVDDGALQAKQWRLGSRPPRFTDPFLTADRPYLRRPYSIAGRRDASTVTKAAGPRTELDIMYRVIGRATRQLEKLTPGDEVSLLGPLGHGFIRSDHLRRALLIGGGVGVPPILYLAERLASWGIAAVAFIGVQRADLLPLTLIADHPPATDHPIERPCLMEFARHGISSILTTDDGSLGIPGRVTTALRTYLLAHRQFDASSGVPELFCCGPTAMMRAVSQVAAEFSLPCQAALEQPMACGMGTCQSCVMKYRPPGALDWVYKLTCTDGPVFHTADIIWS